MGWVLLPKVRDGLGTLQQVQDGSGTLPEVWDGSRPKVRYGLGNPT